MLFLFISSFLLKAQVDNVSFHIDSYYFKSIYDTANYCSTLSIFQNSKEIYKGECSDKITSIEADDLEGNGKKLILIEYYTGGAHCCEYVEACQFINGKFVSLDTIYWGNVSYKLVDLKKDGKLELEGYNDMFAYAFTNFAQSAFAYAIYKFKNGKFYLANSEFKEQVENNIKELKGYLDDYLKSGFDCPKSPDEDTFNTDAGAVKALLAPIVADYSSIGKIQDGYDFVNKVYKCPDKDKFIQILKTQYNLK